MNFIVIFKLHIINVKGNCRRDLECVIKSTYNSDKDIDIDERGKKSSFNIIRQLLHDMAYTYV
jgi:hypothetical protein